MRFAVSAPALFLLFPMVALAQSFTPPCTVPYAAIEEHHPIDSDCGLDGDATGDPPHAAQNRAKNNLCAAGGPALLTFLSFKKLQEKVDKVPGAKSWTRTNLPPDRSVLTNLYTSTEGDALGEGVRVRFAAWLMKLRKGGGESVNCGKTKKDEIDMHLVLAEKADPTGPECSSVTAEVIPHLRPASWDGQTLLSAIDHPLRFTGHLMYDAAHRPCSGTPAAPATSAPARRASWEIHPVYAIEVCKWKSLTRCKANDDSLWTPLDQWPGGE
jgi:hypothetical protein